MCDRLIAMTSVENLEPIAPAEAVEWYLDNKSQEITQSTIGAYRTSLNFFVEYCISRSILNINKLSGRDVERYRAWRREKSADQTLEPKTMRDQMYLLRDFLDYLESIDAVRRNLHRQVVIPKLRYGDGVRNVQLKRDRAIQILNYLDDFKYASLNHVFWAILCQTGRRIGGLHALDVDDYYSDVENPHLAFRHRPEQETRLKNGSRSETNVNISEQVCETLDAYLEHIHPGTTDDHGREPLLATEQGRLSRSTMRKYVYQWSRPCKITGECPHDRAVDECDAAESAHQASKCPSSVSPHAIRHGYISSMLDEEVPKPVLSGRCDVSESVIDKHYDERSEADKQDLRKRFLDRVCQNDRSGYAH